MSDELKKIISQKLAPDGCMRREEAEAGYPPRKLVDGALVTRLAPSPTGFVHLGTIYAGLVNYRLARQSSGVFFLRIEDTDKSREVEGGRDMIIDALKTFNISYEEGPDNGGMYGPYIQSQRGPLYMSYALWLLEQGRAYPCFADKAELEQIHKEQIDQKLRPGYYGKFAVWRNKSDTEIKSALEVGKPFVLRFLSEGDHSKRIKINDALKGQVELPENDLDVPLLKSDGLPTYHLAHVVDDFLMGTNLVIRGDEWLSSAPLHIELCTALGIAPFNYGHLAPISVLDNGSKRKLSKRKDENANIKYWIDAGYPPEAIEEYLLRLMSSSYEDWRNANPLANNQDFKLDIKKLAMSRGPLLDEAKLANVSRDYIASIEQEEYEKQIINWISQHDFDFAKVLAEDPAYTSKVLTIERDSANRRKDLAKWSEAKQVYSYFFDSMFNPISAQAIDQELPEVPLLEQTNVCLAFLEVYHPNDDQPTWLQKLRSAAMSAGYAPDTKTFNGDPSKFKGTLADFAKIIRVKLTGRNQSPDLYSVMQIMGQQRVRGRLHS